MKFLMAIFFFLVVISTWVHAAAPLGVSGQSDTSNLYPPVVKAPNKTVTKLTGGNALIETGNKNILTNPDFEHQTQNTGWTLTAGTFTADNTPISGAYNAQITLSAQSLEFYQDSTLYASQFADGVQGLAYVRVRTTVSGIKVCSRQAGVTSTSNCVNVSSSGKWGLYKIPFVLGATSNGISIHSNAVSVTGDVEIDDAFVGAQDLVVDTTESRLVGGATISGCYWSTASTAYTDPTVTDTCTYTTFGDALAPSSSLPAVRFKNLEAGEYQVVFSGSLASERVGGSGSGATFRISDGSKLSRENVYIAAATSGDNSNSTVPTGSWSMNLPSTKNEVTLKIQAAVANTNSNATINKAYAFGSVSGTIRVYRVASNKTYSSTNANYSRRQYTPTFTAFGTPTNVDCYHSRDGEYLEIDCKFVSGTTSASEARVSLPDSLVAKNTGSGTRLVGYGHRAAAVTNQYGVLSEPNVGYVTFDAQGSQVGLTKQEATNLINSGEAFSFFARIPIEGWENSNVIIGSFDQLAQVATIKDVKASGTHGGSSVAGWQTRTLNTLEDPSGIITNLATNQFTLPAGEYDFHASAPAFSDASTETNHKVRIRNITDATTALVGTTSRMHLDTGSSGTTESVAIGRITISTQKTFEVQHYIQAAKATYGLGYTDGTTSGESEVYTQVKIRRLK